MEILKPLSFLLIFIFISPLSGQKIAEIEIELPEPANGIDIPVSVDLNKITFLPASDFYLKDVTGSKNVEVPFQIEIEKSRNLNWIIKTDENRRKYVYELVNVSPSKNNKQIKAVKEDGALIIKTGDKKLLSYFYKTVYPPEGIDTSYKRSGFIHPLWSPHGQVLTRIQPPDHYHHYGIWNPWTHVLFESDTVDFWNMGDKQGTVRFADFTSVSYGSVFSEFEALHNHIVFRKNNKEKTAINELQAVKVYKPEDGQDYYIADINIQLSCASESPVRFLEYRYGGLGWRASEEWDKYNSEVLTSEGKTRKDADGSQERWFIIQGEVDKGNDYAGAAIFSYPSNYNHPEPVRIWPIPDKERGDVFANFSPTKNKDWLLEPGNEYLLKYRLIVFNNRFTKEKAESAWHYFANPPLIKIHKE